MYCFDFFVALVEVVVAGLALVVGRRADVSLLAADAKGVRLGQLLEDRLLGVVLGPAPDLDPPAQQLLVLQLVVRVHVVDELQHRLSELVVQPVLVGVLLGRRRLEQLGVL